MKRGTVIINSNSVIIQKDVWMTDYEITDLFGVTSSAVNSQVKAIYKSGVMSEKDTTRYIGLENGNRADIYNLEIIIALAFRLNSLPAKKFREWIIRKAVTPTHSQPSIIVHLKDGFLC